MAYAELLPLVALLQPCLLAWSGTATSAPAERSQERLKAVAVVGPAPASSVLVNFNTSGSATTRFDSVAAAIDAHDGHIARFGSVFYLYGTSYDCGYEWGNPSAPFCGFKVYASLDLANWTDQGFLFDARAPVWQTRCNGKTYGCYRPHVVYNRRNHRYVLWINVYDNRVGYRVFTSTSPVGPFAEIFQPTLARNEHAQPGGLNNGDHDVFVDEDDVAYIAYTDWRSGGAIVVERLNDDYTSGSGACVRVTPRATEAPALFKRQGNYYLLYSDPNCGYCSGTGTSYRTALSPLGPWSSGITISTNSCGGQPAFVTTVKVQGEALFLYGSDLWNNGAKNEALANFYWAPLTFAANGSINPIHCQDKVSVAIRPVPASVPGLPDLDNTSGTAGFTTFCDIAQSIQRSQSFVATRTGLLSAVSVCSFQSGHPLSGLTIEIRHGNHDSLPVGEALSSTLIGPESIGWAPKLLTVHPGIPVKAGETYVIVLRSPTGTGSYGIEYRDDDSASGCKEGYSRDDGITFSIEQNRTLLFSTFIHPGG